MVAAEGDRTAAALASELAAEIYGLEVLARHVEDQQNNTTRFLVMAPEPRQAPLPGAITTFVFRVRNVPAALYKAMGGFATNGVNMTKLESYMLDGQFTATQFYADIEGHPDEPRVRRALDEVGYLHHPPAGARGLYPQRGPRRTAAGADGGGGASGLRRAAEPRPLFLDRGRAGRYLSR